MSVDRDLKLRHSNRHKIQPAWIALVEILHRVEEQPFHQPVGRTTFQKMAFVATAEGIPTGLEYVKGSYGPYSRSLDDIKKRLADANLIREERLGRMFEVKTGWSYEEARKRFLPEIHRWEAPIAKTSDLFLRMDTNQAELTATVLFAANHLVNKSPVTEKDIFDAVMEWKQRRRPKLEAHDVGDAIRNLGMLRWVNAKASPDLPGVIDEFGD